MTLTAIWSANTNTPYVVKHYQQNIEDDEYTLFETKNYSGTSDSTVTAPLMSYTGFTAPTAQTVTVSPDGSLVVEYYYTRNNTVTFVANGGDDISSVERKYGSTLSDLPNAERSEFTFGGWFCNTDLSTEVTTMPANDLTVYAWWQEETKPCLFKTASVVIYPEYIGGNKSTSIGGSAFSYCTGLTSVTIGDSVTSIGAGAFLDCTGLTSVTYKGTKAQWNAITKGSYWNQYRDNDNYKTIRFTVTCTDGLV